MNQCQEVTKNKYKIHLSFVLFIQRKNIKWGEMKRIERETIYYKKKWNNLLEKPTEFYLIWRGNLNWIEASKSIENGGLILHLQIIRTWFLWLEIKMRENDKNNTNVSNINLRQWYLRFIHYRWFQSMLSNYLFIRMSNTFAQTASFIASVWQNIGLI